MNRFTEFQKLVRRGVEEALAQDGHCKHYEGRITLTVEVPPYAEAYTGAHTHWTMRLDCYVLGPARHYTWHAVNEDDLFRIATRDVEGWIAELHDDG